MDFNDLLTLLKIYFFIGILVLKVVRIGILRRIMRGRWDRGSDCKS